MDTNDLKLRIKYLQAIESTVEYVDNQIEYLAVSYSHNEESGELEKTTKSYDDLDEYDRLRLQAFRLVKDYLLKGI